MQQAVEAPVARQRRIRHLVVVRGQRPLQVEYRDAGFGRAAGGDLGVHGFELIHVAADQNDARLVPGAGERDRAAQPRARTGDGDHAARQLIGSCDVCAGIERGTHAVKPPFESARSAKRPASARRAARHARQGSSSA